MYEIMDKKQQKDTNVLKNRNVCTPTIQCSRWPKWLRFASLGIFDPFRYLPSWLGGYGPYTNRFRESFSEEFDAVAKAVKDKKSWGPISITDPRRGMFLAEHKNFKWIYDKRDGIILIEPEYKHSIAAAAGDIATGGSGEYEGGGRVALDNDTGHYRTHFGSLPLAEHAWKSAGFSVAFKDRPELPRLFGGD